MSDPADDWVPYRLEHREQWLCRWLALGGRRFDEPFFEETLQSCLALEQNGKLWRSLSSLDFLCDVAGNADALAPTAFIFHVSRCGSTLLTQLLGLDPQHIVLSEVPLFDALLRLPVRDTAVSSVQVGLWLRAAIALHGRRRFGEQRLFIKLDSWHFHYAPRLRELYPDTPFIMLCREPLAVRRSQLAKPGTHAVPGLIEPELFGMTVDEVAGSDADAWLGKVLASYYSQIAVLAQDRHNLLLDYRLGGETMLSRLASHVGMELDVDMGAKIQERCRFHSKHPEREFFEAQDSGAVPSSLELAEALYQHLGN